MIDDRVHTANIDALALQTLGGAEVLSIVTALCRAYRAQNPKRKPAVLVALGGTAMALHGLRDQSHDVDLYTPDACFASQHSPVVMIDDHPVMIDVTTNTHVWGEIDIVDIEADSILADRIEIEGQTIDLRVVSIETMMILKVNAGRTKDRADITALMGRTTPEAVFRRLAAIWKPNEKQSAIVETLDRLVDIYEEIEWKIEPGWFSSVPLEILKQWDHRLRRRANDSEFMEKIAYHARLDDHQTDPAPSRSVRDFDRQQIRCRPAARRRSADSEAPVMGGASTNTAARAADEEGGHKPIHDSSDSGSCDSRREDATLSVVDKRGRRRPAAA
jgi:hypothetical protein